MTADRRTTRQSNAPRQRALETEYDGSILQGESFINFFVCPKISNSALKYLVWFMTIKSNLSIEQRLELVCEAIRYCQKVRNMGMVKAAWSKALREPIFFMWERRNGGKKTAAQFQSLNASGRDWGSREIVYDHAVPFTALSDDLMAIANPKPEVVREILDKKLVCCVITKDEDRALIKAGLNSKMPEAWDGEDPFARYKSVGIKFEPNPRWKYEPRNRIISSVSSDTSPA
ncbi:MAG TPA: hypothetical protein VIN77_03115 [Aurantimonas sp.]